MIKINLLSPELIKKEERIELVIIGYAIIIAAVIVAGSDYFVKFRSFKVLESRVEQSEKELAKYQSIQKQVEALQAAKNVLETKKSIINSLMLGRLNYVNFMENILDVMSNNLWFRNMATQLVSDNGINVTMDAEALDNYAIADFITSLSQSKNFNNVELGPITSNTGAKTATSSFKLTFLYRKKS
jgi:Tfp pilus assembly protein PilN